uniref:PY neuropeptide n=1 Tax=Platynereis dumerilii TaxID=6359 RepID=V5TCR8_PLADU|nr:PY neuropeptide precursor [Platynereis dumerilii]
MDLKTGIICSLSLVLLICTVCSDAFAIRRPENEELVRALARLDRALGEMISSPDDPHELSEPMKRNEDGAVPYKRNEDGSTPYKRNEGSSRKRLAVDGPVPYKRFSDESLDRVLRYLLDMEERLHERNTEKRDHDIPFPFAPTK